MGKLDGTITLTHSEYRPCIVKGRKALFHRWEDKSEIRDAVLRGTSSGVLKGTLAIIEYEDGNVTECYPYEVRFCDGLINEYSFANMCKYEIEIAGSDKGGREYCFETWQPSQEAAENYARTLAKERGCIVTSVCKAGECD